MIEAMELWIKHADGQQQVIRLDHDITVRSLLPGPGAPPLDRAPVPASRRQAADDLLAELADDAAAFEAQQAPRLAEYALGLLERLRWLLGAEDEQQE